MFEGKIEGDKIVVEEEPEEVFQLGGYGKLEDEELKLEPFEAMNLVNRNKLSVFEDDEELSKSDFYKKACKLQENFHEKLLVYEDLRKRGFLVRPGYSFPCDLRVYERGTSFTGNEKKLKHVKWLLNVVKTNSGFSLSDQGKKLEGAKNIRANLALGIIDEEGDVTYYELNEEEKLNQSKKIDMENVSKVKGFLEGDTVIVWKEIEKIYEPYYFGKRRENRLELNLLEALYLNQKDYLEVGRDNEKIGEEKLKDTAKSKDEEFEEKYKIYKDLRDKGFLVRSGFKFGTHFRVYDRGVKLKRGGKKPDEHTKWVIHSVPEKLKWSYPELSRFVRLALNIRSKPTLGVLNKEKKYYRIRRITP